MIQFPETARAEWEIVAEAAKAEETLRQRIARDTKVEVELERLRVRHEAQTELQQELNADQTPELKMFTLASFQNGQVTAPADLIEGVLKDEGLCVMVGPSGSGKSTLAFQMLHSLMTGEDWLGQTAKPLTGSVGVVSYDMSGAMVFDWMNGYPSLDPSKVHLIDAYKTGNPLGVRQMRQQIVDLWKAANVEVIVIDSFSASFFGQNQNDAAEVMGHYRDLKRFALQEVGARAVIIIAHSTPSSPDKIRGSTVHHDVGDSIVVVDPDLSKPNQPRTVRMAKYRAGRGQKQMDPVVVSSPDDVTHLVGLDVGAMTMAGLALPPGVVAQAFPDLPDTYEDADTESQEEEDDL